MKVGLALALRLIEVTFSQIDCYLRFKALFFEVNNSKRRALLLLGTLLLFSNLSMGGLCPFQKEAAEARLPEISAHNADHHAGRYRDLTDMVVSAAGTNALLHNPALKRWNDYAEMYARGDFPLEQAVIETSGNAMTFLGYHFYFLGMDYSDDALAFFQKGAAVGNTDSQYQLGIVFLAKQERKSVWDSLLVGTKKPQRGETPWGSIITGASWIMESRPTRTLMARWSVTVKLPTLVWTGRCTILDFVCSGARGSREM